LAPEIEERNNGKCSAHSGILMTQEFQGQELKRLGILTEQIFVKLDNINSKLISRPGWFVTFIIALLISLLTMSLTVMCFAMQK
jgi:hypothetical protein